MNDHFKQEAEPVRLKNRFRRATARELQSLAASLLPASEVAVSSMG